MYAKCGEFGRAQDVFEELPVRNLVTWTALAAGYVQNGDAAGALRPLECMHSEGFSPNQHTYVCILKACGMLGMLERGRDTHVKVAREGYVESNIVVGTSLVDMYSRCGAVSRAREVFDRLPVRNMVTWNLLMQGYIEHGNLLMQGYIEHGHAIEALQSYELMQYEGLCPDEMTFVCILKACGEIRDCDGGRAAIHMKFLNGDEERILIATALVDMHAKCGALAEAKAAFGAIPLHNLVLWTALSSRRMPNIGTAKKKL